MQNLEAMQARYVGTGHSDTTKYDWVSNIVRDSYASYIGHPPILSYMSVGMGEPKEKVRAAMIEKMVRGAGNPPEVSLHWLHWVTLVIHFVESVLMIFYLDARVKLKRIGVSAGVWVFDSFFSHTRRTMS